MKVSPVFGDISWHSCVVGGGRSSSVAASSAVSLFGSTFVTAYELVVLLNDKLSIQWSLNGLFTVIRSKDALIIVRRKTPPKVAKGGLPSASGFSVGNGIVCIVDLAYLQSGVAVNEMDYDWQRQALTCFTEIRRNRGKYAMRFVRWIPSSPGLDSLLAVGGTDGELEIVDLTER
jgi:hypothetical protein